ncbi:MAG: hypothetical protein ACPG4X_14695 [Pikeienuella sp.]
MTSSGSVDFDQTGNQIIKDALVKISVIDSLEDPTASEMTGARRQLNRMVKAWQTKGVHLWTRREAYLFVQKSQAAYNIGPSSTEHTALIEDAVRTELSADAASGASSISVDSTSGIAVSDNIGVVLDDNTIQWFTVSAIPGAITLSGTLSGAASTGNQVFAYTNKINRPLRLIDAQRTDDADVDTPIIVFSHQEYQQTPNKTEDGKSNNIYYHPQRPQGVVYLWPRPETAADRVRMTVELPIEDFDATSNTPDFPTEWLDALVYNLGARLIPDYAVPADVASDVRMMAAELFDDVLNWDVEEASTYFQPDMSATF